MAFYRLTMIYEVANSGRSPSDTNHRALKAAEVARGFLGRARNVKAIASATLENGTSYADGSDATLWDHRPPPRIAPRGEALDLIAAADGEAS